ncbi:MAG: T9SS type A sorting domain-containing protein, partial [Candidatus Kapaibacterium sp.]
IKVSTSAKAEITFFPNPVTSSATVSYSLPTSQHITLELIDQLGRVVRRLRNENEDAGIKNISLSLGDLPEGMYYLRRQSDDGVITKKVVVRK